MGRDDMAETTGPRGGGTQPRIADLPDDVWAAPDKSDTLSLVCIRSHIRHCAVCQGAGRACKTAKMLARTHATAKKYHVRGAK